MRLILGLFILLFTVSPALAAKDKTVYDRVMKTGTIRCGYYVFEPATIVDPNTGELSGLFVDMWDILGKNLGLEIKWVEEVSFGTMYEGLITGRYDVICTPDWPNARTAKVALYTVPVFFSGINVYARADDERFDYNLDKLNGPEFTISTQDGSTEEHIAATQFPDAKTLGISRDAPATQLELNVVNGKADAVFLDHNRFAQFDQNNPGKLKKVNRDPIQIYPFKVPVLRGETDLKFLLDEALVEILYNGEMDRLIDKWELFPDSFLRVAPPYKTR